MPVIGIVRNGKLRISFILICDLLFFFKFSSQQFFLFKKSSIALSSVTKRIARLLKAVET